MSITRHTNEITCSKFNLGLSISPAEVGTWRGDVSDLDYADLYCPHKKMGTEKQQEGSGGAWPWPVSPEEDAIPERSLPVSPPHAVSATC